MTKDDFINRYALNSGMLPKEILKDNVALPCHCNQDGCKGWAMVSNNPLSIKCHNDINGD